jgi:hypothetical protein
MLVVKRNFADFFGERARDDFRKCHMSSLRVRCHGEVALAMQNQEPKTKVSPRLRAVVGLMMIETV